MAKNEVGEFELVLGNRQLLSVFFIVVTLLGVFFFMGYIVGRNSTPGTLEASTRKSSAEKSTIIDSPGAPPPSQVATASDPPPMHPPETETKPAAEPPKTEKLPVSEPARVVEEKKKPEPKKEEKKPAPEPAAAAAPVGGAPRAGTYLQLAAVPKADAELLISVLRKKGFSAASTPAPSDPDLFRVLVGPLTSDSIPQTRASLTDAGMPGAKAMIRKY